MIRRFDQAFDRVNVLYRPMLGESNVKFKREHIVLLLSRDFWREKRLMQQISMKLGEEYVCSFYCSFIFDRIKQFSE